MGFHRHRSDSFFKSSSPGNVDKKILANSSRLWNQPCPANLRRAAPFVVLAWILKMFYDRVAWFQQVGTALRKETAPAVVRWAPAFCPKHRPNLSQVHFHSLRLHCHRPTPCIVGIELLALIRIRLRSANFGRELRAVLLLHVHISQQFSACESALVDDRRAPASGLGLRRPLKARSSKAVACHWNGR